MMGALMLSISSIPIFAEGLLSKWLAIIYKYNTSHRVTDLKYPNIDCFIDQVAKYNAS